MFAYLQRIGFLIILGLLLSNCAIIYRPDLQQGNIITQSTVAQLKLGMSQEQVRYLLGTPVLQNPFQPDDWYYIYVYRPGYGKPMQQRVHLLFSKNRLQQIQIN